MLREEIPDLNTLEQKLDVVFDSFYQEFLEKTNVRRLSVAKNLYSLFINSQLFILALVLYALFESVFNEFILVIIAIGGAVFGIKSVFYLVIWNQEKKKFSREFNQALAPIFDAVFNQKVSYLNDDVQKKLTIETLKESELISNYDLVRADDVYLFSEPSPLSVRELVVERKESDGKNSHYRVIFTGVLVETKLKRTLTGTTFVSTEGDKSGFGLHNFWTKILSNDGVEETELEWNEFEKDLHVATNNGIEARYIMTPDFMEALHKWWLEHKQNIRIVFKDNKMAMLLPEVEVKIATMTTSTEAKIIKKNILAVVRPLWRTVTLLESVKL